MLKRFLIVFFNVWLAYRLWLEFSNTTGQIGHQNKRLGKPLRISCQFSRSGQLVLALFCEWHHTVIQQWSYSFLSNLLICSLTLTPNIRELLVALLSSTLCCLFLVEVIGSWWMCWTGGWCFGSPQRSLFGLQHFPFLRSSVAYTLGSNVSLNKLSHTHRLSSQDVILYREDVWNASHRPCAPPLTQPFITAAVEQCSVVLQSCMRLISLFDGVSWCGITRQHVSLSQRLYGEVDLQQLFTLSCLLSSPPPLIFAMSIFLCIFLQLSDVPCPSHPL